MPNVYREKECPYCGVKHRRRGPYCSRSHSKMGTIHSEETKQKIRDSAQEYLRTPEGIANAAAVSRRSTQRGINNAKIAAGEYILQEDDYALDVPFNMNEDFIEYDEKINW